MTRLVHRQVGDGAIILGLLGLGVLLLLLVLGAVIVAVL